MSTDTILAGISIGMAVLNAGVVAGMYVYIVRSAWNIIGIIRAGEDGEVWIDDPFFPKGSNHFFGKPFIVYPIMKDFHRITDTPTF